MRRAREDDIEWSLDLTFGVKEEIEAAKLVRVVWPALGPEPREQKVVTFPIVEPNGPPEVWIARDIHKVMRPIFVKFYHAHLVPLPDNVLERAYKLMENTPEQLRYTVLRNKFPDFVPLPPAGWKW